MTTARRVATVTLVLALGAGCGGPTTGLPRPAPTAPADRCVVALRFTEGPSASEARTGDAPELPTTAVSLVRICDRSGRVVRALGLERGVCQRAHAEPGELLVARCWWPGATGRTIRVAREGGRLVARRASDDAEGAEADAIELVGEVEVPSRARVDPLDPVGAR
ncbi:MAG: hypothetical protein OHK0013_00690 [Sandaracinaceae bacterium]